MTPTQRTDDEGNEAGPRAYGDGTSPGAAGSRSSASSVATVLAAAVLGCAIVALVFLAVLGDGEEVVSAAGIAAGALALLAAALLARGVALLRREHRQLVRREADALRMAELDDLTGLGNYRMFTRQLAAEIARSRRYDDPFSLVLLDLDGFKAINDDFGHLAGDDALRLVAGALRGALREEDVCCRQGGDEFAVIAVRAGEQEALELSERLAQAVREIPFGEEGERRLGASAGWATFGHPARSVDELILRADAALLRAKRANGSTAGADFRTAAPRERDRRSSERDGRLERGESARLALLSGLARALVGARDERTLAETTVAFLAGAFDTVGAAVVGCGPDGAVRLAALSAGTGDVTEVDVAAAVASRPVARRALAAAGPAVVEEDGRAWLDGTAVRSELAVAIRDEGLVWGYLFLASDRPRAYEISERTLAEAIAEQLGRALACRRLLDRLREAGFGELYRVAAGSAASGETEAWRIAELAWQVGRMLALGDTDLRALYLAALFHDVGTVGVPAVLLSHPGELHDEERAVLREHALIGERLLRALPLLREAAPIVRHEHERFDGSGYPDGIGGEEIPLSARILLACDAFVSMTSLRPWRPARSLDGARAELARVAGAQLDPRVVEALLEALPAAGPRDVHEGEPRASTTHA
jgi:diguanylate cyclase (GGDEF)-like protein